TGILGICVGVILNAFKMLLDFIANLSSSIGAVLALLSGVLGAAIERSIPKGIWQKAYRPLAIFASILTIGLLTVVPVQLSIQTSNQLTASATATAQAKATFVAEGHTVATLQANASATSQAM